MIILQNPILIPLLSNHKLLCDYNSAPFLPPPFRVKQEKSEQKEPEELKVTEDWRVRKERRVPEVMFSFSYILYAWCGSGGTHSN